MKFTLLALLPAVLWTLLMVVMQGTKTTPDEKGVAALILSVLWFLTWGVIGIYWVGRIWRAATRDRAR
jgi:hypothetical protein